VATSRGRGHRAGLTRAAVIAAAREVIAEAGTESLTMRALSTRLGVAPNALYSHVRNKTELVDAVLDDVLAEIEAPTVETHDPVAGLEGLMVSTYDVLTAHPQLVAYFATRQGSRGPNARALGEVMTTLLARAGVDEGALSQAVRVLVVHAIGSVALTRSLADPEDAPPLTAQDLRATFAAGMRWLLAGILRG
jgi:TetR/AcrR family tetracycline transcriptional repressor